MLRSMLAMLAVAVCCQSFIVVRARADEAAGGQKASDAPAPKTTADPATKPYIIPELERQILAGRREIKTAELEIESDSVGPHGHRVDHHHIWIGENDRVRSERPRADELDVLIYGDPYAFQYTRRPGQMENPDRSKRPGIMAMPKAELADGQYPLFLFSNPLRLMFNPVQFGILHAHKLDDLIGANDRTRWESHPSTWHGEPSTIVSFYRPRTDNYFEYEVVPSKGFNIVRWRLWGLSRDGSSYEEMLTCELRQIADSTWFPSSVTTDGLRDGQMRETETLTIKVISMNRPLDDKIFSLAGLPPGVAVIFDAFERDPQKPRRPAMIWDGEKVRPFERGDFNVDQLRMRTIGK